MRRSSVVDFAKHRQLVFAVNRFHQPTQPTFISGTHPGVSVDVISLVQQRQYALHKLNVHRRRVTVSLCVTVTAFLIYIYVGWGSSSSPSWNKKQYIDGMQSECARAFARARACAWSCACAWECARALWVRYMVATTYHYHVCRVYGHTHNNSAVLTWSPQLNSVSHNFLPYRS